MTHHEILDILINERLSTRIRRALAALEKSEQPNSPVKPDMKEFHDVREDGRCFA